MRDLLDLIRGNIFTIKITDRKIACVLLNGRNELVFVVLNTFTRNPFYDTSDSSTNHSTLKERSLCD